MTKKKITALICMAALTTSLIACGSTVQTSDGANNSGAKAVNSNSTGACDTADTSGVLFTETTTAMSSVINAETEAIADGFYTTDSVMYGEAIEECCLEVDFNTEEYSYIKENSFLSVETSPLSTFAADVDTGSYTNFRRMLRDGYTLEQIPRGALRTEEMINYFDYAEVEDSSEYNRFGVSYEINVCPWNEEHELLMLTVGAKEIELDYVGNNFVFLIDSSGSMNTTEKGSLAIESFKLLTETLTENDRVSIVTYSGSYETLLESCPGNKYNDICKVLDSIQFSGGTNGSGGITAAYELAAENYMEGGNNRVIIASDGDMNLGITSNAGLTELISGQRDSGIFLTVLGYGSGNYSDANMESIADYGNGNYYYIDCLDEAQRVLVDKLKQTTITVAKDVKFQVEFNPLEVSEYRLIGYENRTMAAEDFTDDSKDGGEMGAGQTVTVLYELVRNGDSSDTNSLKYQSSRTLTDEATSGELLTLSVRYKDPDGDSSREENFNVMASRGIFTKMSTDFSFVAGLAELSMLVNDSDYLGTATLDSAYNLLIQGCGRGTDAAYRKELCEMLYSLKE